MLTLIFEIRHASAAHCGSSHCVRSKVTIAGPSFLPPAVSIRTALPAFNFAKNSAAISDDMPGGALFHLN
jgi:hypothetical protein